MQEFATRKPIAPGMDLRHPNCLFTKYRIAARIMKITAILLTVACLQLSAKGLTQNVTISVKDAPLLTVLKAIKKQTGFTFLVTAKDLGIARNVSITAHDLPLHEVLDLCFKNQPLTYTITGNLINIIPRIRQEEKNDKTGYTVPLPEKIDVKGRVVNEQSEPVQNVSVAVKGTTNGTTTNSNGDFLVRAVDENATLVFTSVNMETFEVNVKGRAYLVVALQTKITSMQEVVINKGYYTESRRFSTGNVGKVTSKDIEKQPVNNPLLALQGRVPGVTVTQTSGLSGAGVVVRIQGQNSLQNGNNPLYIVDGVPLSTEVPVPLYSNFAPFPTSGESYLNQTYTGRGNTLSFLNPSDIESIEILKDADATAIYGSRAGNGAILITTKKGKSGKPTVDIDLQEGFSQVAHFMKMLNTPQYIEMRKEALNNDGYLSLLQNPSFDIYWPDLKIYDTSRYTNWQRELLGKTAKYTNVNFGISGGTSEVQYRFGGNYHKENTVFPGDFSDQKASFMVNLNNSNDLKSRFHFQISSNYSVDNNQLPATDLTTVALGLAPNAPKLYNDDGSLNWQLNSNGVAMFVNPLGNLLYQTYNAKTNNLIANANLSYDILSGLRISSSFGFNNLQSTDIQKNTLLAIRPERRNDPTYQPTALYGDSKLTTWAIEPQLSYKKSIKKNRFDGLAGLSFQRTFKQAQYLRGKGFNSDQVMSNPQAAASLFYDGYLESIYKYNAGYGRLNYTYDNKYILNITGRRDGSTRFGDNNKFHNFWSVGGAWIFSQESFIVGNMPFLSFGKLKASYGTTGSDQIGDYRYLSLFSNVSVPVPYQGTANLSTGAIPNPYLQWEETKKANFGIDLGFVNDRIFVSANYSNNRSSNQFLDYLLPAITGQTNILTNFNALIENANWEFSLSTENVKSKKFSWSTNFNLTILRNKLVKFPDLQSSPYKFSYVIGQPISLMKLFHYIGVDSSTGLYTFSDIHGNPTTSPDGLTDNTVLRTDFPKFFGGLQNSIQYGNFQLDFLFQFVKKSAASTDFGIINWPGFFNSASSLGNQPITVLNRWQKPGDLGDIQKYTYLKSKDGYYLSVASDRNFVDASYIRLKNLSLSYELQSEWLRKIHLKSCRVYAQAQNLLTITKYKGLDPETPGYSTLPPLRVVTFGLQVKL